ncbi:MAG: NAD-dependent epimerase/dehydratase family protein [Candidatus Binataceae bacterium]
MKALVIGGTGPSGHLIVNGLVERGYAVAILHTGNHEVDEIPPTVEHIHTDPFSAEALRGAVERRDFNLTIAAYGRLRRIAELMAGRTGRFISIGGAPAYRGDMNPAVLYPRGMPLPTPEDAPLLTREEEDGKGWRVVRTEAAVFQHHPHATHFRYPLLYGPYQIAPREWSIVRRVMDGRRAIIVPEDGLTLNHAAYVGNAAHAVLLAVDQPDAAAGQIYNVGDERVLTLRQVIEVVSSALDYSLEIVSMPWEFALPARPMISQAWTTHRVLDIGKIKVQLGYADVMPAEQALAFTARWLKEHPLQPRGPEEKIIQDPFDYRAEDELIVAWENLRGEMPQVRFETEPGYTLTYSGPGGKPRSGSF